MKKVLRSQMQLASLSTEGVATRWRLMQEKRQHTRTPADKTIWYSTVTCDSKIQESGLKASVVDVSDGGMGILTEFPLEPGCILWFDDDKAHKAGIIRWKTYFKLHNMYRVGIQLL